MSVIVSDEGFGQDDWTAGFASLDSLPEVSGGPALAVDVPNDTDPADLQPYLDEIDLIRVAFPNFADGRGFTIAQRLRLMGFAGRLRALGHVLADQYTMARRSGFDEVEISEDLAARQPQEQWIYRANWRAHDYQSRLRA